MDGGNVDVERNIHRPLCASVVNRKIKHRTTTVDGGNVDVEGNIHRPLCDFIMSFRASSEQNTSAEAQNTKHSLFYSKRKLCGLCVSVVKKKKWM